MCVTQYRNTQSHTYIMVYICCFCSTFITAIIFMNKNEDDEKTLVSSLISLILSKNTNLKTIFIYTYVYDQTIKFSRCLKLRMPVALWVLTFSGQSSTLLINQAIIITMLKLTTQTAAYLIAIFNKIVIK